LSVRIEPPVGGHSSDNEETAILIETVGQIEILGDQCVDGLDESPQVAASLIESAC
jgi:hypothetical protein